MTLVCVCRPTNRAIEGDSGAYAQEIRALVFNNPQDEPILRIALNRAKMVKLRALVVADDVLKQACTPTSVVDVTDSIKRISGAAVEVGAPTEIFQDRSSMIENNTNPKPYTLKP